MKIQSILSQVTLVSLSLFSASSQAQDYQAETDFFGEAPVVLTVSRMNKPLADSPASVSIIDRQMIRNSGAREIADIFRMVPGFVVGYRFGHTPSVTYQGLGRQFQRQLQVYIDGRSVFIPSFGGVPWSNLPLLLEDIERVEVTRGPNAVTYGANAFLATINIITRHAAEDVGGKISVTQDLDKNSEARDIYFRVGNQYGDLDWRLTAGKEQDDGYSREFDSKTLEKVNIRTDFLTAYNQLWTVQAGLNQSTFNRGDGDVNDIFRDEETSNSYHNIKWELLQNDLTTTVKISHTVQDVEDSFISGRLNEDLDQIINQTLFSLAPDDITLGISFDRFSERLDFEVYQNRSLSHDTTLVYGASTRQDTVKSLFLFDNQDKHNVTTNRLFSSIEWKYFENLIIDAGFMLEDSNYTDRDHSGRLSIIKKMNDQHSMRFVTSSAKRNPVLYEVFGISQFSIELPANPFAITSIPVVSWQGNKDIKPELIRSSEIGLSSAFYNNQITTDFKLFRYKITDQITEILQAGIDLSTGLPIEFETPLNSGSTTVKGLEASFNYSPHHKNFRLYGGLSRVSVTTQSDIILSEKVRDIESSFPELTAFIGGNINLTENHQLSTTVSYTGEMSWTDSSRTIEDHIKLDLRYQFTINKEYDTQFEIIGYNLYEEYPEYVINDIQEKSLLLRISSRF